MRIWLEKGKQKELFLKEKERLNLTWNEFAKKLGIKFAKLNGFHYEEVLMSEEIFNKLRLSSEYKKFIIQKLNENWGKIKGGKLSSGNTKDIEIPKKSKELAEFWGIVLGDGNVQKRKGYKVGTYNVNITGHSVFDKDYLLNFVKPLGERLFGIKGRYAYSNSNNSLNLSFDSLRLVEFFERENFKAGDKIKNQVTIPDWIKENPKYLAVCLRGLFDTDGSFYRLGNQNSYQVNFKNFDKTLINDVRKGLIELGLRPSKISRGIQLFITKKSEIAKFYKVIGFHNSKHLNKINAYFKAL